MRSTRKTCGDIKRAVVGYKFNEYMRHHANYITSCKKKTEYQQADGDNN